jgi:hypothetical protein
MSGKNRIIECVPIALAIAFGLCAIWLTGPGRTDFADGTDYLAAARMLVENGTYPAAGELPFFRPPLYPLFIAIIWSVFPASILAIKLAQVALFGLSSWLIFKTGMRITNSQFLSGTGAVIFAVNPFLFYLSAAIQSESLQIFLIALSIYILVRMLMADRVSMRSALILGLSFGLAALCKPSALGVGLVMGAALLLIKRRQKGALQASAVVVAAMFLSILPWSFYNLKTKGEFILINDAAGYNLWLGNLPESIQLNERSFDNGAEAIAFADYFGKVLAHKQMDEWENTVGYENLSLTQRERLWEAKAFENMRSSPAVTAKLFAWKFFNFWKPYVNSNVYSMKFAILSALFLIPFYVFGIWGLLKTWAEEGTRDLTWLFIVLAFCVTAIHVIVVSSMRLRLPYVDPFLTVFAGIGFGTLLLKVLTKLDWRNLSNRFENQAFSRFACV